MEFKPSNWNHIQQLSITTLADCPWPPSDAHCSPCTIWLPDDKQIGFHVWGEYAGNTNRKSFYAQTTCVDVQTIKRLAFKAGRMRSTTPPQGHGLFIGFVDEDTLNDSNKLYDPNTWAWAGYLADLPGGTPTQHYYLCADINQNFSPSKAWYLLMVTNGSYETCGWVMGGFGDGNFPNGQLMLWRYTLNEPGQTDGWETMDNWFRGCIIPYTSGAGALVEGLCEIKNPSFPGSAQEGTPYQFIFDVQQHTAFPCGCPETIVWQLFNRDDDTPLHDPVQYTLACGYTGVTGFTGTINFSGSGTFRGQLKVGHKTNGQWMVDDTHNFDVVIGGNGYPCSHWTNQQDCLSHGCYWWSNGTCRDTQETTPDTLEKAITCKTFIGCDHKTPGSCSCGDEGSKVTTFELDEEIIAYALAASSDFYGKKLKQEWWYNGEKKWEYEWIISEHWQYVCIWTWWAIGQAYGPGTGNIKIYLDNVYLGKTNDYNIQGGGATGDIIEQDSQFHTGPFQPGAVKSVASVKIKNTGQTGTMYYNLYEYPGTINEKKIVDNWGPMDAGLETYVGFTATIPSLPGGSTWPIGVKVWGDGEQEPSW